MKIGFYNGYDIWGGGEKWHHEMSLYCKERKDEVVVFTPKHGELSKRVALNGIRVENINISKHSYFNPLFLLRTYFQIKKEKLDVLVFNSYRDVRVCALMARLAGVKKVVFRCGMPIAPKEDLSFKLAFNKGLHYFVPISKAIQMEFDTKAPSLLSSEQKAPHIPNGIDLQDFSPVPIRELKDGDIPLLGNAVRLTHQKGLDLLLKAAKLLKEDNVKFRLEIAGEGEDRLKLENSIAELGLKGHVFLLGHTDDVSAFVKKLDIYTFSSRYEGTARSMIEAMACGVPVVAFNVSSMKELACHEKEALMSPAFDVNEYYLNMKRLITEPRLREKLSIQSTQKVQECFDKVKNFATWYKFLKE